jgi:hypothetical protein
MKAFWLSWKNLVASNHGWLSRAARAVLVSALSASVSTVAQQEPGAGSALQGRWTAVYQGGAAPFGLGTRVQVTIVKDQLDFVGKKDLRFSIPVSTITALSSNLASEHTVTRSQMTAWGGLAQLSPYTVIFLPLGIPVMAATYPIKSKYAYISVIWSHKGTDEEVQFRLNRNDYEPLLTQLRKSTGKEWKNLESDWERLSQALADGSGRQVPFRLDRKSRLGKVDVKPGQYQLIVLTEAPNHGEAYLFSRNEVDIEHLISKSQVEINVASDQVEGVSFKPDDDGISKISEIRIPGLAVRFP